MSSHRSTPCTLATTGACRRRTGAPVAALLLLAVLPAAEAHFAWLEIVSLESDQVEVAVVFGHHPPAERRLPVERIIEVEVISPDGTRRPARPADDGWRGQVAGPGSHLVAARQRPSFWSRTVEGGRNASRREYPDAFSCRVSDNAMKTVIAGQADDGHSPAVTQAVGHRLEIIPEADPTRLSAGDRLPLRVLFDGEPWQGMLRATWAGYPAEHDDDYPVHLETGVDGRAVLALPRGGSWLVHANAETDHPDPAVCDRQAWNAALAFTLR